MNPAENDECINENSCLINYMVTKDTGEHEDSCTSLYQCTQANERIGRTYTYNVLFRTFEKKKQLEHFN